MLFRSRFLPSSTLRPDHVVGDTDHIDAGGLQIELHHARGETDDHLWSWMPQHRALATGDFLIWNFPNAGNPQKVQRYAWDWAVALRDMAALEPELLLPAHGPALAGGERVARVLTHTAEALESLHGQTLALMNSGARLDDVILGCTNQGGEDNRDVARMAVLLAGFPIEVPGQTVNRLCGSGLQAVASAAQAIKAGEGSAFIAGGVESMTRAPYVMLKSASPWNREVPAMADSTIGWRFINPKMNKEWTISLGATADKVAKECGVSRADQDAFAVESQRRTAEAIKAGVFADEIVPVSIPQRKGNPIVVSADEHPRPDTTLDKISGMKPAFTADGTVTAGNASGIDRKSTRLNSSH